MTGIRYRIDLAAAHQGEIRIELELAPAAGGIRDLFLPVWTPGSYLVREYSRHLHDLQAEEVADSGAGRQLPVERLAKNRYRVESESALRIRYSIYARERTVRTSFASDRYAYWNGACVYLWPVGFESEPATVEIELPADWELYCSGTPQGTGRLRTLQLDDLDAAVDTPCLAGSALVQELECMGRPHRFVHADLEPFEPRSCFLEDAEKVLLEVSAVFAADPPPYDDYTFLCLYGATGRGGLEHQDSSTLLAPRSTFRDSADYEDFMGLVAHEFFHVWNVKRMRPADFWRFDYERENYTELLWVAEGFTAYFDDLCCLRAGVLDLSRYAKILTRHIGNMLDMPGRLRQSLAEASFDAWVRFYRQDENTRNSTSNYYSNGALAAFCIDARLRRETSGEGNLEAALRRLYRETFVAGRGFREQDVLDSLSAVAGTKMDEWVRELVRSPFEPNLEEALATYGMRWREASEPGPWLGVRFREGKTTVALVHRGSPAWESGLLPGDEVLAVDRLQVTGATWADAFGQLARVGGTNELLLARDGRILQQSVTLREHPFQGAAVEVMESAADAAVEQRMRWLRSAVG